MAEMHGSESVSFNAANEETDSGEVEIYNVRVNPDAANPDAALGEEIGTGLAFDLVGYLVHRMYASGTTSAARKDENWIRFGSAKAINDVAFSTGGQAS